MSIDYNSCGVTLSQSQINPTRFFSFNSRSLFHRQMQFISNIQKYEILRFLALIMKKKVARKLRSNVSTVSPIFFNIKLSLF